MVIRVLMLLLTLFIASNLLVMLISFLCGINMYEKYGKAIRNFHIGIILIVVVVFIVLAILGLV